MCGPNHLGQEKALTSESDSDRDRDGTTGGKCGLLPETMALITSDCVLDQAVDKTVRPAAAAGPSQSQ